MSDLAKVDLPRRVTDAFNRHDLDAIMAAFGDDCVLESPRGPDPWGERFVGKDNVRSGVTGRRRGASGRSHRRYWKKDPFRS